MTGEPDLPLISHFERIAGRHGGRLAISSERGDLTYSELNAAANRLAHLILHRGGGKGDRVGVLMSPGPGLYAAMLGALKAGRIVVALNPTDPPARLSQIAEDADPALMLTDSEHAGIVADLGAGAAGIVVVGEEVGQPCDDPHIEMASAEIAFLTYTSGSTGRPKAVMKSHDHVLHHAVNVGRALAARPEDRILMLASLSGGQGLNTTWTALAGGACLTLFPAAENGLTGLSRCMTDNEVTIYISASSLFRSFVKSLPEGTRFPAVRVVKISSDRATAEDFHAFRRHFPHARLMSAMGSSETGHIAFAMFSHEDSVGEGRLPVGRCFPGVELIVTDEDGRECPPGVVGDIQVRGRHLASGYWRDPALTAACFSAAPGGASTFRGGDLGHLTADRALVLQGRKDATIKIRGHRVDLAEVEQSLSALPGVEIAAAGTLARPDGEPQLIAYIVLAAQAAASERRLRLLARATMARHLVPSAFVFLDRLPRTPNGKIDRHRLGEIALPARGGPPEPPVGVTETLLVDIWEEVFERSGIGAADDFFELGGDSLLSAIIAARVYAACGVELAFGAFAEAPVLRDMANLIDRARALGRGEDEVPIVRAPRDRPIPLSPHQAFVWAASQRPKGKRQSFGRPTFIRLNGALNIEALRRALNHVVERHESLRTRFRIEDGAPSQVIDPPGDVALPLIDLSSGPEPEKEAEALRRRERERGFDLLKAPPVRFSLIRLDHDRHLLLRYAHHIILDAPSWNIFLRDMGEAYAAIASGAAPSLPPLPLQYADYAVWQRQVWRRDGARYQAAATWWKEQLSQVSSWRERAWLRPYMRKKAAADPLLSDLSIRWGLDAGASRRLDDLARGEGATFYNVRLATLVPLLALLTNSDKVVIGGIFTNRNRIEFEPVFGLFAGGVTLIFHCDRDRSFRQLIGDVRRRLADIHAHAGLPYEMLREEMAAENIDIPPHHFGIHMPTQRPTLRFAGLELTADEGGWPFRRGILFRFDEVREQDDGCILSFDARIYEQSGMRDLLDRLVRFSEFVSRQPDSTLREAIKSSGIGGGIPRRRGAAKQQALTGPSPPRRPP